jgi:membrane-bound lytic murein transglycosylase D
MPMEIALLPMIESAYNPVAYSTAHAAGMWQFIPSTGKDFGLRQNWWYDGRRDVLRATDAALNYLEKLYGMFGDWQLALASYNWGEGAVGRSMERNRQKGLPTDYESLTVPAETRGYIPKLVAIKNIISDPARFGLTIADIPNEPYFDTVMVKRHIDVKLAAKFAEMTPEEFKFLNPGHSKLVIKAGDAERIILPRHKVETFLANYQSNDKPFLSWQAVRLRPGEKAERVAADHGMTLTELKELNGLQNQKRLVAGQPLLVPLKEGAEAQLLDLPSTPVTLSKALQAAKNAQAKRQVKFTAQKGGKVAVRKVASKGAAQGKQPPRQLRAENGKRVKVVATTKPAASRKAQPGQKVKVAAR